MFLNLLLFSNFFLGTSNCAFNRKQSYLNVYNYTAEKQIQFVQNIYRFGIKALFKKLL